MGALWWWIRAGSAAEITTAFAEVEVIDDPATVHMVESWSLDELNIGDAISGGRAQGVRPSRAMSLVWASAPAGTSTGGAKNPIPSHWPMYGRTQS